MFNPNLSSEEKAVLFDAIINELLESKEFMVTRNEHFVFISNRFAEAIGLPAEELFQLTVSDLVRRRFYTKSATKMAITTGKPAIVFTPMPGKRYRIVSAEFLPLESEKTAYVLSEGLSVEKILEIVEEISKEELPLPILNDLKSKLLGFQKDLVFRSKKMEEIIKSAERIARYDTNTLILGESGVGKDAVARYIQKCSNRRDKPFIPVNVAQISPSLLESELFGYVRGAFTNASKEGKIGIFEAANGGTVFLDEIGDVPLETQVKILRVLENREIFRVGSNKAVSLNIRIIAATNKDLRKMMLEKTFREDLYYRLNVVTLQIPPLRERPEDIEPLVHFFLQEFNLRYSLRRSFNSGAMRLMEEYEWPGNVRNLRNFVERALIMSETNVINEQYVQEALSEEIAGTSVQHRQPEHTESFSDIIQEYSRISRRALLDALVKSNGNKSKAAKLLHISRSHFYNLLRQYQTDSDAGQPQ